ncbi:MAG TPA: nuclear transport factor 2 family protein [Croceicoccus sp.]|nr:nuclear transport factor 2 family protein [Croceicoccus sp.]
MPNAAIEISNLLYTYAEHLDAGRFREVARMFDHGCMVVYGEEIHGIDALEQMVSCFIRVYDDGTPKTRHVTTNPIIDVATDERTASCRSLWTLLQCTPDLPLQLIGGGRYHDRFAVIDGKWEFTRREYAGVDFWGDASQHLLVPAEKWEG